LRQQTRAAQPNREFPADPCRQGIFRRSSRKRPGKRGSAADSRAAISEILLPEQGSKSADQAIALYCAAPRIVPHYGRM